MELTRPPMGRRWDHEHQSFIDGCNGSAGWNNFHNIQIPSFKAVDQMLLMGTRMKYAAERRVRWQLVQLRFLHWVLNIPPGKEMIRIQGVFVNIRFSRVGKVASEDRNDRVNPMPQNAYQVRRDDVGPPFPCPPFRFQIWLHIIFSRTPRVSRRLSLHCVMEMEAASGGGL